LTQAALTRDAAAQLEALLLRRTEANRRFFNDEADRLARICHLMAERFARGGRLIAFGRSPADRSDARHVAVEFVHPVIVGKRALPAIGLAGEGGHLRVQVGLIARPEDIAIAFGAERDGGEAAAAIKLTRERGCLTIAFAPAGAEWEFMASGNDEYVRQELVETLYHVLWELVHVFFDHRGLLTGRDKPRSRDAGAASFLYPFLAERENNLEEVLEDVRRSVVMKSEEIGELRVQTLTENGPALIAAADGVRTNLRGGGTLLALGNGGSATDAMDVVADFRTPAGGAGGGSGWSAIDLTEDTGIITAVANDIGPEAIFSRQVIAYGRAGDVLLALSTSGNSGNVIAALEQGHRQGLMTIAMVGYDGGRVASEGLADHVIVTRSQHIPRIQEAQASAYHVLRELVG
jgi:D-sedoheptulose 7-phosphate isomerase